MKTLSTRLLALLPVLALAAVPACASDNEPAPAQTPITGDDQEVVDIPNTDKVSNQSIGNCWIYATSAWAEALRRGYSGEQLDISETYLSYIDWFHGIQDGEFNEKDGLQTGGWFGEAAEYLHGYGVMNEGAFIPEEANAEKSARQASALAAINTSLKTGVLKDPAARRDPNIVRDELDKAFQLKPEVIALLDESFGHDLSRSGEQATIPAGKGLKAATDVPVGLYGKKNGGETKVITLDDAVGTSSYDVRTRSGAFAWNESSFPYNASSQRNYFKTMQRALHARRPVILVWFVDFAAMDRNAGTFLSIPAAPGRQGGHMTVLEDYQVSNVPGFGTLAAGTVVTDPKALEAALAPTATIDFLRIKNSWGTNFGPPEGSTLKGYHDLYSAYLTGMIPRCDKKDAAGKCLPQSPQRGLTSFVLPPTSWDDVGVAAEPAPEPEPTDPPVPTNTCGHAICATGDKLVSDCDPCVTKICERDPFCCNTQWDGQCKAEVKSICEQDTCKLVHRLYDGRRGTLGDEVPRFAWPGRTSDWAARVPVCHLRQVCRLVARPEPGVWRRLAQAVSTTRKARLFGVGPCRAEREPCPVPSVVVPARSLLLSWSRSRLPSRRAATKKPLAAARAAPR